MGLWYLLRPRGRAKRATAAGDEAAPLPSCGPSAGDIAEFPEDSRRAVFEDRRQGLLILVRRHILDEAEIDDLARSEEHTSELQSRFDLVCRLLLANIKYQ